MQQFDKIIIGAGLYGLHLALFCCKRGQKVFICKRIIASTVSNASFYEIIPL